MEKRIQLLSAAQADVTLTRLAYEIYENNIHEKELVLAAIVERGVDIGKQLKKKLEKICELKIDLISVKIDKSNPIDCQIPTDFIAANKNIVFVDDVANSGKTMLFAIRPFLKEVPKRIQIAVLIDRKHKQFPVSSDFIGLQVSTTLQEQIIVEVEKGKVTGAYLS